MNRKHASFIHTHKMKNIAEYNPAVYFLGGMMFFYQNVISTQIGGGGCPYHPTCSEFSKQSIEQFGIVKGLFMSADRLTRCSGMSLKESPPEWYDPITEKINNPSSLYGFKKHE